MDNLDFTEDETQNPLVMSHDDTMLSSFSEMNSQRDISQPSPSAYIKEKVSGLMYHLWRLHLPIQQDSKMQRNDVTSESDAQSCDTDGLSLTSSQSVMKRITQTRYERDLRPRAKMFIRPALDHLHTRSPKKNDPVARHLQYKQHWEMFKASRERDRRALHWEIKEKLAYQPPPPKPRRVYVPNSYIVPTEKKRSDLMWEIRNDLAKGLLPRRSDYRL